MSDEEILEVSDVSQFKRRGSTGSVTTLPSGLRAKLRLRGMQTFLKAGVIPNSLIGIIQDQLDTNTGKPKSQEDDSGTIMKQMMEDPEKLNDLLSLVDTVTLDCFIQPRVYPVPEDPDEIDDSKLYVDEIDFEDKMYVFGVAVGGTKDLEQFREGFASSVESAQSELQMESTPFRLPGT